MDVSAFFQSSGSPLMLYLSLSQINKIKSLKKKQKQKQWTESR